jgi:hypothetical protein
MIRERYQSPSENWDRLPAAAGPTPYQREPARGARWSSASTILPTSTLSANCRRSRVSKYWIVKSIPALSSPLRPSCAPAQRRAGQAHHLWCAEALQWRNRFSARLQCCERAVVLYWRLPRRAIGFGDGGCLLYGIDRLRAAHQDRCMGGFGIAINKRGDMTWRFTCTREPIRLSPGRRR